MRFSLALLPLLIAASIMFVQDTRTSRRTLNASTYYIVISGHLLDENTIVVRGASNLPPRSKIRIQVGDGARFVSESICASVGDEGLFRYELRPIGSAKFKFSPTLAMDAFFRTDECEQPEKVLQIVGKHGQYLGNDNYDGKIDIHMQMTPGMINNPQLFQESGWDFGLSTSARVSE